MAGTATRGLTADDVIHILDLAPHPEGGHFRETFRDTAEACQRAASSAIYFLLKASSRIGTRSMPQKPGISMPAMRCCLRPRRQAVQSKPFAWGLVSITARGHRLSFQKGIGSEPEALAHGRSSVARSRPPSHSMASRSPLRTSLLICRRGGLSGGEATAQRLSNAIHR